jgi:tagatose-6-phosphate ketose/aldose isomerase
MKFLGLTPQELELSGGTYTAMEIAGQPQLWRKVAEVIKDKRSEIASYVEECFKETDNIILTGAGTSAYIGISLEGLFFRKFRKNASAVPTTDLVTHPGDYFSPEKPLLLVSFARSGNSPESKAAVELADKLCKKCYHLIITCDPNGALARYQTKNPKYTIVLPPESNDKSLAMTGSYSGMLLAGTLTAWIFELEKIIPQVETISFYGEKILSEYAPGLQKIAIKPFQRAVFLGSGPFFGTATESHLKLQELTNGNIVCIQETFLGLRHGPKAVIHGNTIVIYILSTDEYVHKYEKDLVNAVINGHNPVAQIGICEIEDPGLKFDLLIKVADGNAKLPEELLAVCFILPGQILAFYKSLDLGLKPDSPSTNNVISRVVEGVVIYDYHLKQ